MTPELAEEFGRLAETFERLLFLLNELKQAQNDK
jgi:hypothetical protein